MDTEESARFARALRNESLGLHECLCCESTNTTLIESGSGGIQVNLYACQPHYEPLMGAMVTIFGGASSHNIWQQPNKCRHPRLADDEPHTSNAAGMTLTATGRVCPDCGFQTLTVTDDPPSAVEAQIELKLRDLFHRWSAGPS